MATLSTTKKSGQVQLHQLDRYTTLGRASGNTITVGDNSVSSRHAVIRKMPTGHFQLEDLQTTNGTFVGQTKVSEHILAEGDIITLGETALTFSLLKPAKGTVTAGRKSISTALQAVRVTVSDETADVVPTLQLPATDSNFAQPHSFSELRQDYERLLAGYQLIHAIVGEEDLDVILNRIVHSVVELMSADRAAVLLVIDGKLEPKVALQTNSSTEVFTVSTSILNYVSQNYTAVVCNDLGSDSRFSTSKSIIMQAVRSAMCVPMLHDGELVGVLHMDSRNPAGFQQNQLEIISTIANTAAYAIKTVLLKEKMRAMERQQADTMRAMISGASHFINNPLAVIRANLNMFEEWSHSMTSFHAQISEDHSKYNELYESLGIDFIDEELEPMSSETSKSAARIGEIVRALHAFENEDNPDSWSYFDMADLLNEVVSGAEESLQEVAKVHRQLAEAPVHGVKDRVRLLFENLLSNAKQAICVDSGDNWIVASCHVSNGRVLVSIDDTGCGIPETRRHRVFAPFETDRLDGPLGLGLAVSAEIARQHNAQISIRSREGGGTRLLVDFPLHIDS